VSLSLANAGTFTETITLHPTGSNANFSAALPAQTLTVTGVITAAAGFIKAVASAHTPEPVAFGHVHLGAAVKQALTISNTAPAGRSTENLDGTLSTAATGFTATGSFTELAGGATDSISLVVTMNTASTGIKDGTATLTLASDGTGIDTAGI